MNSILRVLNASYDRAHQMALLVLRVGAGFFMLYGHGWGKLAKILGGDEIKFADPLGIGAVPSMYMAGFAEGVCAMLLIGGLFSRAASMILAGNFIVVWYFHSAVLGETFNDFELPLLYLVAFITLTLTGGGKYSLDAMLFKQQYLSTNNTK